MKSPVVKKLAHDGYGVAIICPLEVEVSAVRYMLDEEHVRLPNKEGDSNRYIYGRMGKHNVVIGYLPQGSQGVGAAATVATDMKRSFPQATLRLLVGIGGGVPSERNDIRLGDVVVSMPTKEHGGVVQYDLGKETMKGFERKGFLEPPPTNWRTCVVDVRSKHRVTDNRISAFLGEMVKKYPRLTEYRRPATKEDVLFPPTNEHVLGELTCQKCDYGQAISRPQRANNMPMIFYGLIASGNRVVKNAKVRDQIAQDAGGALCFEMEAAGLINDFRCIVIRGISDYADSHKNDDWHAYGAAAAAGCAKDLLTYMDPVIESAPSGDKYRIPVELPYHRNRDFKGREEPLQQVSRLFWASDATEQRLNRQEIALCGLSGTGKSQIALEYAYRYTEKYSAIFWINTKNESEMNVSTRKAVELIIRRFSTSSSTKTYWRIARSLGLDEPKVTSRDTLMEAADKSSWAKCLRNWLSQESNNSWLLVLDNYDDQAACDLRELLPTQEFGHVLITSCRPNPQPGCHKIEVPAGIEQGEAVDLLVRTMGRDIDSSEYQNATDIVESVGRLPFAITLIGACLSESPMPLHRYARDLNTNLMESLEPLNTVWKMSFEKLSAHAKHLFWLFSFMGNEDIPDEFLQGAKGIIDWMTSDKAIYKAVGELLSLSLVGRKQDHSLYIHQLLHEWARNDRENVNRDNSKLVVDIIRSTFAFDDRRTATQCAYERRILPHIDSCVKIFNSQLPSGNSRLDDWSQKAAYDLARVYTNLGYVREPRKLYERSLVGIRDPIHILDLKMMDSFGMNLRFQGKYDEALSWCLRAQDGIESRYGKDSSMALAVAHNVALIYKEQGKYPKAIAQYKGVLRRQEHKFTSCHSSILETQHQLACVLRDSGEYPEALVRLELVHKERKKSLGEDHPDTLDTLYAIATVLEMQGEYKRALKQHVLVLEEQRKSLGDSHYSTLESMDSIASIQERLGYYDKALASYRRVLKVLEDIFGVEEDHPWIAFTLSGVADILLRQAKYDEAETTYKKAYASLKGLHIGVRGEFPTATNIARVLREKGQYEDALNWCEIARKGLKELGEDNEHMLAVKVCTARIVELRGMYSEALLMSQELCEAYEKKYGENHAETLKTRCVLGSVFNCQGRYKEALEQFQQSEAGLTDAIGPNHHQTLVAVQGQADVLEQLGDHGQVLRLCERIQKTLGNTLGEMHPQTLMAVYRSGSAKVNKGENETGLEAIKKAMDGWRAVLGEKHPYIFMCLESIGNVYKAQGESDQAISSYKKAIDGYHQKLRDDHPWAYRAQVSLAGVLVARDPAQHDEAERLYSAAIIGLETTLGSVHPWTSAARDDKNKAFSQSKVSNRMQRFLVFLGLWVFGLRLFGLWMFGLWIFCPWIFGLWIFGPRIFGLWIFGPWIFGPWIFGLWIFSGFWN